MSTSNELAHLRKLLDMSMQLKRSGVVNALIFFGVFAALTYGATSNLLLSITVGFGVFLMIGVGHRVVGDILEIETSRTIMFFSGSEEELERGFDTWKISDRLRKKFL